MTQEALPRIGVFVCDCGSNIAGTVDTAAVDGVRARPCPAS